MKAIFIFVLFWSQSLLAITKEPLVTGFYHFSYPNDPYDNGYPESKYEQVIQTVYDTYKPIIESLGGELHILSDWSDGAVNAWAFRLAKEYWLEIPGGMSRYYLINEEAFIMTICHELGHLLGGEPKNSDISFEGQADYFSSQECSSLLFSQVQSIKILPENQEVTQACSHIINNNEFCQRSLKGGLSLTSYYAEIANETFPQISTPSLVKVSSTLTTHPPAQCRLDSIVAGYFQKLRPACWYKE